MHGAMCTASCEHISGFCMQGVQWVCFFQDTNGLVFRALPAALGGFARLCSGNSLYGSVRWITADHAYLVW